jgi:hypothetical protein
LLLKTNNASSRQSFFEVNAGNQVVAVGKVETTLAFDPFNERLKVQYFTGKLSVIDRDNEHKFEIQHTETEWEKGKRLDADPQSVDELSFVNYNRFLRAEDPLVDALNDVLLSAVEGAERSFFGDWLGLKKKLPPAQRQAYELHKLAEQAYFKKDYRAAKDLWEEALVYSPVYTRAREGLEKLKREHPEMR